MQSLRNLMIRSILLVVGMLVFSSLTGAQNFDERKAGVVKITTTTGQTGTGFIVRVEPEVVYIITASHVIIGDNQPDVEFFTKRNVPIKGEVLPGAEVNDDIRGLALVVVRGKDQIPDNVASLPFQTSPDLVSGGEKVFVIGHPGGGGDWAVVKRDVSNRVGRDLTLDPGLASRFSGGPIIVGDEVVGIVMANRGEFGLGITHKSVHNFMEGFGVYPTGTDTTSSVTSSQTLPQTKIGKGGVPMVLVPAGEFMMGSPDDESRSKDELPRHKVFLDDFYLDIFEGTTEHYAQFLKALGHTPPKFWEQVDSSRDANKPVVGVTWEEARDYCNWAGKRLPTEAEWEKAARGTDERKYPWGQEPPTTHMANFDQKATPEKIYSDRLMPVGSYENGKSPLGVYDMAGNVWEWTADWYDKKYYENSPKKNPKGPETGEEKVMRGGSWDDFAPALRSGDRSKLVPSEQNDSVGFRCAQDGP